MRVPFLSLHHSTRAHIEQQPTTHKGVIRDAYDCGCLVFFPSWTVQICEYHLGWEHAMDNVGEEQP